MEACRLCKIVKDDSELRPLRQHYKTRVCKDCDNTRARRNHAARPKTRVRNENLKRRYGLSLEDYELMLEKQQGVCALCENPPSARDRFILNVDHCHATSVVRGLLCIKCNTALGKFNDDPELLRKAATYLERSRV